MQRVVGVPPIVATASRQQASLTKELHKHFLEVERLNFIMLN